MNTLENDKALLIIKGKDGYVNMKAAELFGPLTKNKSSEEIDFRRQLRADITEAMPTLGWGMEQRR